MNFLQVTFLGSVTDKLPQVRYPEKSHITPKVVIYSILGNADLRSYIMEFKTP